MCWLHQIERVQREGFSFSRTPRRVASWDRRRYCDGTDDLAVMSGTPSPGSTVLNYIEESLFRDMIASNQDTVK